MTLKVMMMRRRKGRSTCRRIRERRNINKRGGGRMMRMRMT